MSLSQIRAALLQSVATASAASIGWPVIDGAKDDGTLQYPSVRLLKLPVGVTHDHAGLRKFTFTVRLLARAEVSTEQYELLLDAIGDGAFLDQLVTTLRETSPHWGCAIPSTTTEIDELPTDGTIDLQYADITVEVWP